MDFLEINHVKHVWRYLLFQYPYTLFENVIPWNHIKTVVECLFLNGYSASNIHRSLVNVSEKDTFVVNAIRWVSAVALLGARNKDTTGGFEFYIY